MRNTWILEKVRKPHVHDFLTSSESWLGQNWSPASGHTFLQTHKAASRLLRGSRTQPDPYAKLKGNSVCNGCKVPCIGRRPSQPSEEREGTLPWEHTWPAAAPMASPAHINEKFSTRSRARPDQEIAKSWGPYLSLTEHCFYSSTCNNIKA